MNQKSFYVDTCIYLNLWKMEKRFWKIAKHFFEKYKSHTFYYSGFVLKEIQYKIKKDLFIEKRKLFCKNNNFIKFIANKNLIDKARDIEIETNFEISFFDIIHMLIAKETNSILITRDQKLIQTCKEYNINVNKPEEL